MKQDDKIILDIKRLGINGEGIGYYKRKAVFIDGAIPGETHEVTITKSLDKMNFAKSERIIKESKSRVQVKCPYYKECGGCSTMHISYEQMLEYKKELIIEAINRYTHLNPKHFEIKNTIKSEYDYYYRNKAQLPLKKENDKYSACMIQASSNKLIPVKDCMVQNKVINKLTTAILKMADELEIPPFIAKFNRGVLRYLSIRVNEKNEALVCFVCYEKSEKIKQLAKKVIELPEVKSVYENFNTKLKAPTIYGEESNHLEGDKYLIMTINNIKYELYPTTFFQLNTSQAKNIFDIVKKTAKLSKKEIVLDAFCGVGAIGLNLASMANMVIGIENNKESVDAAIENAKINKIKNAKFICGDANKLLPSMINDGKKIDVIIVDPPRVGLGDEFIKTLKKINIKRLIYVSCNPATLAKDIEQLSDNYQVNSITPLDMFPNTPHVESISLLVRKDTK